jgi:ferrous iron transport protein B
MFNGLTGGKQQIGNWPGVTVERKEGSFSPRGLESILVEPFAAGASTTTGATATVTTKLEHESVRVVDLPGIYSLAASSQDEVVARDYLLSGEPDLVVNVVDASNIQRNLFLTLQLIEMRIPVLVVLNMMDVAEKEGVSINVPHLAEHLQCPVTACVGIRSEAVTKVKHAIVDAIHAGQVSGLVVHYPDALEEQVSGLESETAELSEAIGADRRWTALALLEGDPWVTRRFAELKPDVDVGAVRDQLSHDLQDDIDVVIADAKYGVIHGLSKHVSRERITRESVTNRLDSVVLNRVLALPIFFAVMYGVFWFTMFVGGGFIDFFDILVGTFLVDGLGSGLTAIGAPEWLVSILAGGVGSGIQTVATFIPILFAMFIALSVLEDSGYMARAAYVMDRFMRSIGLPGRSFVPMMVGFGCTVPAIMASRTLATPRDRFMTNFMSPFMSCGARLPVYALFSAAFFGARAGTVVFSLYVVGIVVAIATGFLLKFTLFRGTASHFVMELPPYHLPRPRYVLGQAWQRLSAFVKRAGITITIIVTLLSFVNSIGTDGSMGNEGGSDSVLASMGRFITPAFGPMGIDDDNWQATVGLFTGVFAKEIIVGTLSSLYGQADADEAISEFNLREGLLESVRSIPAAFRGAVAGLSDPLGTGLVTSDSEMVQAEVGADPAAFTRMREQFSPASAYAYLLFVLLYVPCVAAISAAMREMGSALGWVLVAYTGVVAWSLSTLFYQFATGPALIPVLAAVLLLAALVAALWILGRTVFRPSAVEGM